MDLERYHGCLMGLALGDALGAPYEGGIAERLLWKCICALNGGGLRCSDDTQMTIDVGRSLLAKGVLDQDDIAKEFANSYAWSRGYGPSAAKLLKSVRNGKDWRELNCAYFPEGSWGNGAAMRTPIIALFYPFNFLPLMDAVEKVSVITHAHPLAIQGAKLIAATVFLALKGQSIGLILDHLLDESVSDEYKLKLELASKWLENEDHVSVKDVVDNFGNQISALDSVVTSIYIALRFRDETFLDMVQFCIQCKGDTDTIASMAGAIWGTFNGMSQLRVESINNLEKKDQLFQLAINIFDAVESGSF